MAKLEKAGQVHFAFRNLLKIKECFLRFKFDKSQDSYTLFMYKDQSDMIPFRDETFTTSDLCGLDWGTFELSKPVLGIFHKRPKICTYITILTKEKSITIIFIGDEGEKFRDWKDALVQYLYKGRIYVREKLRLNGKDVMLQAGNMNISLTTDREDERPAGVLHHWSKDTFYDSLAEGRMLKLIVKPNAEGKPNVEAPSIEMDLECLRKGRENGNGNIISQEENVSRIRNSLFEFVVCYWYTKEDIYNDLQDGIYANLQSDIFDLNKMEDVDSFGGSGNLRRYMHNLYKKVKDSQTQYMNLVSGGRRCSAVEYTDEDQFVLNAGYAIHKIKTNEPRPDTLRLSKALRTDICYKLYSQTQIERSADWTALASQIGE